MLTGISEDLHDVSDSRKTAVINNETQHGHRHPSGDSTGGLRGTEGEQLHILPAGVGLGRASTV